MVSFKTLREIVSIGASEAAVLLGTAAIGFAVVRWLPKETYGSYAFLIACAAAVTQLGDLGLSHCFVPLVGTRPTDKPHVEAVLMVLQPLRLRLYFWGSLGVGAYWLAVAWRQGWLSPGYGLAAVLGFIGPMFAIREQLLRFWAMGLRRRGLLARVSWQTLGLRAVMLTAAIYVGASDWALTVIMIGAMAAPWAATVLLSRGITRFVPGADGEAADADPAAIKAALRRMYLPLLGPAVLYAVYANFGSFAIAWLSNGATVAEFAAMGRLSLAFTLIDRMVAVFIIPRLAQAPDHATFKHRLRQSHLAYLALMLLVEISAIVAPGAWIFVLGAKYANLRPLLWVGLLGPLLTNVSGFTFTTMSCRGITRGQLTVMMVGLGLQAVLIAGRGLPNAAVAFQISAIVGAAFAVTNYVVLFQQLRRIPAAEPLPDRDRLPA